MQIDKAGLAAAVAAVELLKAPPMETTQEGSHTTIKVHGISVEDIAKAAICAYLAHVAAQGGSYLETQDLVTLPSVP